MKIKGEYVTCAYKKAYILFDLDNGNHQSKGYAWIFSTRKDAIEHRKFQMKDKNNVRLSKIIKVTL